MGNSCDKVRLEDVSETFVNTMLLTPTGSGRSDHLLDSSMILFNDIVEILDLAYLDIVSWSTL